LTVNARLQLARLLPLAVLVLLAAVGLRGGVVVPDRWDGPLKAYGVAVGITLEVILAALFAMTVYLERVASRRGEARPPAGAGDDEDDDRDVAGTLRFLLRLALGAAMAAVAICVLVGLHLHAFTLSARHLTPLPKSTPANRKPVQFRGGGGALNIPLKPILYALVIIVLLAALVVSIWWARRLSQAAALPGALPDAAEDSEGLREAVASGRAAMADLDDARAAIIACYEAMEQTLAERGASRGAAGTPDELLRRATDSKLLTGTAARRLTTLFYEARFSTHELGPGSRDAATAALDDLATELGGVTVDTTP
jgi:hypothetical protein